MQQIWGAGTPFCTRGKQTLKERLDIPSPPASFQADIACTYPPGTYRCEKFESMLYHGLPGPVCSTSYVTYSGADDGMVELGNFSILPSIL